MAGLAQDPNHLLRQAISGLKNFVVVDNGSTSYEGYEVAANIEANQYGPTYEMGALLHAFQKYDYDRYLLLQDSNPRKAVEGTQFKRRKPLGNPRVVLSCHTDRGRMDRGESQYNAFSATREQIQKLIDAKFLTVDNLPRDKVGSQSWERVLGLAFAAVGEPIHFLTTVSNTQHAVFEKTFLYRN